MGAEALKVGVEGVKRAPQLLHYLYRGSKHLFSGGKQIAGGCLRHWKPIVLFGGIAEGRVTGRGAVDAWSSWIMPEGEGLYDKAARTLAGNENVDKYGPTGGMSASVMGSRNYESAREAASEFADRAKDTALGAVEHGREYLSNVHDSSDQEEYAEQETQERSKRGLSSFTPFNSYTEMLKGVFGNSGNQLSMAAMIPAALLLFGNYGFMAKIAGLMLGGFAVNNIDRRSGNSRSLVEGEELNRRQQARIRESGDYSVRAGNQEDNNTVHRGRRL